METEKDQIYRAYVQYVMENRGRPMFLFRFLEAAKIDEDLFRKYFKSCRELEKSLWSDLFLLTRKLIESEEVYLDYSIREKLLAFYYTWIEYLREYRTFLQWSYDHKHVWEISPSSLDSFQKLFKKYASDLVQEGKQTLEVAERPFITDYYGNGLWLQMQFILKFWLRDSSAEFENTDAAIEKAVNFSMDIINSNAVDSFFGLSKFVVQKW